MKFCFKVLRLLIFISTVSFFFAMIFKMALDFQEDIIESRGQDETVNRFISHFGMESNHGDEEGEEIEGSEEEGMSEFDSMVIFLYFSFTSLTTVGFGDFHPRSDFERIYIAFGLLFGVAIFSYIMGEFIDMISNIDIFGNSETGTEDLERFFGVLRRFNGNNEVDMKTKREVESYFEHRIEHEKSKAI
jgi:hypothetical protein